MDINEQLNELLSQIAPVDKAIGEKITDAWDRIGKPLRSLGLLEESLARIGMAQHSEFPDISKKGLVIMCADNGIVEEGVTQSGQEITAVVAENFLDEKSCVAIMCKKTGTGIFPIDIGMAVDTPRVEKKKEIYGTANFTKGPAMDREIAIGAILTGIEKVKELKDQGYKILATGEMGIGNTTTASAITSVFFDVDPAKVTGRGAGLSTPGLERKINCIRKGIEINKPDKNDPIGVLSKVGGLDIAGLTGVFLGGAIYQIPVVVDGFISAVAAMTAVNINPLVKGYILTSHKSKEPAAAMLLEALEMPAMIDAGMCLGEGSGAVAAFALIDLGAEIFYKMAKFGEIAIEQYEHLK